MERHGKVQIHQRKASQSGLVQDNRGQGRHFPLCRVHEPEIELQVNGRRAGPWHWSGKHRRQMTLQGHLVIVVQTITINDHSITNPIKPSSKSYSLRRSISYDAEHKFVIFLSYDLPRDTPCFCPNSATTSGAEQCVRPHKPANGI